MSMTKHEILVAAKRMQIEQCEKQIYEVNDLTADQRFEISMELSIARQELADLLGFINPTAEDGMAAAEEDEADQED